MVLFIININVDDMVLFITNPKDPNQKNILD